VPFKFNLRRYSPGLDGALTNAGEDVAALMIAMVGVEVVPPYELGGAVQVLCFTTKTNRQVGHRTRRIHLSYILKAPGFCNPQGYEVKNWFQSLQLQIRLVPLQLGREMGSEPFEATQAAITRDAAKKWRTEALEAIEKGEESGDKDKAKVAAPSTSRPAAAARPSSARPAAAASSKTKPAVAASGLAKSRPASARPAGGKPSLVGLQVHGGAVQDKLNPVDP
jgi:hypothetical protein